MWSMWSLSRNCWQLPTLMEKRSWAYLPSISKRNQILLFILIFPRPFGACVAPCQVRGPQPPEQNIRWLHHHQSAPGIFTPRPFFYRQTRILSLKSPGSMVQFVSRGRCTKVGRECWSYGYMGWYELVQDGHPSGLCPGLFSLWFIQSVHSRLMKKCTKLFYVS